MFSKNTANANKSSTVWLAHEWILNRSKNVIRKRENHCIECSELYAEFDECSVCLFSLICFTFRIIANLHLCDVLISSCPTFWTNNTMCVLNMWNDNYFFFFSPSRDKYLTFIESCIHTQYACLYTNTDTSRYEKNNLYTPGIAQCSHTSVTQHHHIYIFWHCAQRHLQTIRVQVQFSWFRLFWTIFVFIF